MSGFPLWSEANAEDLRGKEFIGARLSYCSEKLAHYFGGGRVLSLQELYDCLGLAQEIQGYVCTALSLFYEEHDEPRSDREADGDA